MSDKRKSSIEVSETVKSAVDYMIHYINTYPEQYGYEDYTPGTYINDMLYGFAVSLNPQKYQYADGYEQFKEDLAHFLELEKK